MFSSSYSSLVPPLFSPLRFPSWNTITDSSSRYISTWFVPPLISSFTPSNPNHPHPIPKLTSPSPIDPQTLHRRRHVHRLAPTKNRHGQTKSSLRRDQSEDVNHPIISLVFRSKQANKRSRRWESIVFDELLESQRAMLVSWCFSLLKRISGCRVQGDEWWMMAFVFC